MTSEDRPPATYGELTTKAAHLIAAGSARLAAAPCDGILDAANTILAYRQALIALDRHARHLTGIHRHALTGPGRRVNNEHVRQQWTLLRALNRAATQVDPPTGTVPDLDSPWSDAARALHAATELLATHHDDRGRSRSPDSDLVDDPVERAQALARLATSVQVLLDGHAYLRPRTAQAGVPWPTVERQLPDPIGLRDAATPFVPDPRATFLLDALTVARPRITATTPTIEFTERLRRLRRSAWQLTQQPAPSVTALTDIAALAITIHHIAAKPPHSRHGLTWSMAGPDPHSLQGIQGVQAWTTIRIALHHLRTTAPVSYAVRVDTHALHNLCTQLASSPPDGRLAERELTATLATAMATFTDIADWNAVVVGNLDTRGRLFTRGRHLIGDDITDDPALVHAKLADNVACAPPSQIARLLDAYQRAGGTTTQHPDISHATQMGRAPGRRLSG